MMLSIGLMSGTSMDGIDAALLETDGSSFVKELGHTSIAYQPEFKTLLKSAEYAVRKCTGDLHKAQAFYSQAITDYLKNELDMPESVINQEIVKLSSYIHGMTKSTLTITFDEVIQHSTQLHGGAVKKLLKEKNYTANQIDVVGYHGQTLFHRPSMGVTVQVGDGQSLAETVAITVVNDFRRQDMARGGQGAPFAPLYHQALAIRDKKIPAAVVNCGGIANITLINNTQELDLIGFDSGPGNGLIDRLIRLRTQGKENMDTDGHYGKQGKINKKVLGALYEKSIKIKDGKNYFTTAPPKSLDYGDMELIPELKALSLADACRTLEAFTAYTIVDSLKLVQGDIPKHWILAGGGWKNPVIRQEFEERLREKQGLAVQVHMADEVGWNSQALEAQIFAYLAVRSLQNRPISMPNTTGVPRPLSGGQAYLPSSGPTTPIVQKLIQGNASVLDGYR